MLARILRNPFASAGWLLFALIAGHMALGCGTRWTFGPRYGLPVSLVLPGDPSRYADGSPIDPLTRSLIRSGSEEDVLGACLLILSSMALSLAAIVVRDTRRRIRILRERLELECRPCPCHPKRPPTPR